MFIDLIKIIFLPLLLQVGVGVIINLIIGYLDKKKGKNKKLLTISIVSTCSLVVIITTIYSFNAATFVPDIKGITMDDARVKSANNSLLLNIGKEIYSDKKAGRVIAQEPVAGKLVKKNTIIFADVSKGLPRVPSLIGVNLEIAKKLIETDREAEFHFELERGLEYNLLDSTVMEQYPLPGDSVQPGSTIRIVYNSLFEIVELVPYNREGPAILPDSRGTLKIKRISNLGFVGDFNISNLEAKHSYTLCINGNMELDLEGNKLIYNTSRCITDKGEGYVDFTPISANMNRQAEAQTTYRLPAHDYTVKVFVKDNSRDYKVLLFNDIVRFKVIR